MIHLDVRAVILGLWVTLLITTLSSILTIAYFEDSAEAIISLDGLPTRLDDSWGLIAGFWLAGLLSGAGVSVLEWGENERSRLVSGLAGFAIATLIRVLALGPFLPSASSFWKFMSGILSLHDIPEYHAFLLLVWLGSGIAVAIGVLVSYLLKENTGFALDFLPPLPVEGKNLVVTSSLMSVAVLCLLVIRNLDSASQSDLSILNTRWLIMPLPNMVVAALLGFFLGGGYFAHNRFAAGATVFLGAGVHVVVMLVLESYISTFDVVEESTDLNNIPLLSFIFFWLGTPLVGAIAALALHNLRDAFSMSYEEEAAV